VPDAFLSHISNVLLSIDEEGLTKHERLITTPQRGEIRVGDREVINLCANNYLGLSDHPDLIRAAKDSMEPKGYGMASVRFICGTQDIHRQLEQRLARFLNKDDAILFAACFDANGGLFEPLLGPEDAIISDSLNHASIIDGVRLCKAQRFRYANNDMTDLEDKLKAAKQAGHNVTVPFKPGRMDASQKMTDVRSFAVLEPTADAFRNYYGDDNYRSPVESLIDQAALLNLSVPEMTALVGGMRALNANHQGGQHGVFTDKPGTLTNDFFVNLLDMSTVWSPSSEAGVYEGKDRKTGTTKWTATPVDLIFGSNSELRAVAEVYAFDTSKEKFVNDFVSAWSKVMQLDQF